jgi:hypothetical protein
LLDAPQYPESIVVEDVGGTSLAGMSGWVVLFVAGAILVDWGRHQRAADPPVHR